MPQENDIYVPVKKAIVDENGAHALQNKYSKTASKTSNSQKSSHSYWTRSKGSTMPKEIIKYMKRKETDEKPEEIDEKQLQKNKFQDLARKIFSQKHHKKEMTFDLDGEELVIEVNALNMLREIPKNIKKYFEEDNDSSDEEIEGEREINKILKENSIEDDVNYSELEIEYLTSLDEKSRKKLIDKEVELFGNKKGDKQQPLRFKLLNSYIPKSIKKQIIEKLDNWYSLSPGDSDFMKQQNYFNVLERFPFNKYSKSINIDNAQDVLMKVKDQMDKSVFGHEDAKNTILMELARRIRNPESHERAIGLQGPPGNGKTTLMKSVASALGRPFIFIPLGGITGSDYLVGHDYTYEGSQPGRIVQGLCDAGTMDPVILFDELDKIGESSKALEVYNLLCHLTDPSQNSEFHDKYLSNIPIDISKAMLLFTYNDASLIHPILRDRLFQIKTEGFNQKHKKQILKDYVIPSTCKHVGFDESKLTFSDEAVQTILDKYDEDKSSKTGVRTIERAVHEIISKFNLHLILQKPIDDYLPSKDGPWEIKSNHIKELCQERTMNEKPPFGMYL